MDKPHALEKREPYKTPTPQDQEATTNEQKQPLGVGEENKSRQKKREKTLK